MLLPYKVPSDAMLLDTRLLPYIVQSAIILDKLCIIFPDIVPPVLIIFEETDNDPVAIFDTTLILEANTVPLHVQTFCVYISPVNTTFELYTFEVYTEFVVIGA